jgi:hypothetical protein
LTGCSHPISPAARGRSVTIVVSFTVAGQTYQAQTSMTPR